MKSNSTVNGVINNPTTGTHPCVVNKVTAGGTVIQLANVPGHGGTGTFSTTFEVGDKIVLASADTATPPTVSLTGSLSAAASALVRTELVTGAAVDSDTADSAPGTPVDWTATLSKQGDAVQLLAA